MVQLIDVKLPINAPVPRLCVVKKSFENDAARALTMLINKGATSMALQTQTLFHFEKWGEVLILTQF